MLWCVCAPPAAVPPPPPAPLAQTAIGPLSLGEARARLFVSLSLSLSLSLSRALSRSSLYEQRSTRPPLLNPAPPQRVLSLCVRGARLVASVAAHSSPPVPMPGDSCSGLPDRAPAATLVRSLFVGFHAFLRPYIMPPPRQIFIISRYDLTIFPLCLTTRLLIWELSWKSSRPSRKPPSPRRCWR